MTAYCYITLLGVFFAGAILALPVPDPAKLRKIPKVYNALITSDEPLLPSRTEQATLGQVLYYPPHHTYPASSVPLAVPQPLPQGAFTAGLDQSSLQPAYPQNLAQEVPQFAQQRLNNQEYSQGLRDNFHPSFPGVLPQESQQLRVEDFSQQSDSTALQQSVVPEENSHYYDANGDQEAVRLPTSSPPSPVVYASDVELERPSTGRSFTVLSQSPAPSGTFLANHANQRVEQVMGTLVYEPPPSVSIDNIKNNRPNAEGIPDVPPPPLPVGRHRHQQQQSTNDQEPKSSPGGPLFIK